MRDDQVIQAAADYLATKRIRFVPEGEVRPSSEGRSEVVFLVPEALDPMVVVDPPDVRVLVDRQTGSCELVAQM